VATIYYFTNRLPVVSSHVAVGGQLHCLQSGNPKNPGLQRVHWRPITFGLQGHCPPNLSHSYLKLLHNVGVELNMMLIRLHYNFKYVLKY
jgi:hypothetical protein